MLRLALVEELRRLADSILSARLSREHARRWEALSESEDPKKHIDSLLDEERQANRHLSAAFVVELLQWLRDQPSSAAPVWTALRARARRAGRFGRGAGQGRAPA